MIRSLFTLAVAAASIGCDVTYVPDVGPLRGMPDAATGGPDGAPATGPCVDSDPDVDVSFGRDVRPLLSRSPGGCSCHATNTTSGLNLGSYDRLLQGGTNSGEQIVVPGEPCASVLVQKLGLAPPFGARMPYNGPPFFTAEERRLVEDWIAEGAHDD